MTNPIVVIDAHVHVHPTADVGLLLNSAHGNFLSAANVLGARQWQGVLMLAEMRSARWFESVQQGASIGPWSLAPQPEDSRSLRATSDRGELLIIAGRQVVTGEGIEVLTLGTTEVVVDGLSLESTIAKAHAAGALIVLPWGAGKWLGTRGAQVESALENNATKAVFPGDNGGRPAFWPTPRAFSASKHRERAVVSGTDPLPLPREEQRVGSFGCWLAETIDTARPTAALYKRLTESTANEVRPFGNLQGTAAFVRNQVALRMRKRG